MALSWTLDKLVLCVKGRRKGGHPAVNVTAMDEVEHEVLNTG